MHAMNKAIVALQAHRQPMTRCAEAMGKGGAITGVAVGRVTFCAVVSPPRTPSGGGIGGPPFRRSLNAADDIDIKTESVKDRGEGEKKATWRFPSFSCQTNQPFLVDHVALTDDVSIHGRGNDPF